MSITFTSRDLDDIARAAELLASPLDFPCVNAWRSAVNRALRSLLDADTAAFMLPVPDGPIAYSEEHDAEELGRYPETPPPPLLDGTPVWASAVRVGVGTLADVYGDGYERYLNSAYYREYAAPNRAHDTLSAATALGGTDIRGMALLHFWHDRPDGRVFGPRETTLLRLLFPAFRAGVEAQVRWGTQREDLLESLDALGQPVLLCDLSGRVHHVTAAMAALLAADPEAEAVRAAVHETKGELCRSGRPPGPGNPRPSGPTREVQTATAAYRVSGCLYGRASARGARFGLVSIERLTPVARSAEELGAEYSLTPAESRLATLLAEGRSNAEIADELFISPHTARRHTEKVLLKLNVRSRAQVATKVLR